MKEEYIAARKEYRARNLRKIAFIAIFVVLAAVAFFLTLGFGVYKISVVDAITVFFDHLSDNIVDEDGDYYIWEGRTPRAIGAVLAGIALAVSGTIMQNDFRNPLAEPYTMGIASGAFLGAVLSFVYGFSILPFVSEDMGLMANAFVFSLIPMAVIIIFTKIRHLTPTAMILVGVAIMFLFGSICQIILVTAPSETLADAYAWRVGDLGNVAWDNIPIMTAAVVGLTVLLYAMSGKLNIMYAGDRAAQTLGENPMHIRIITLVLVSFLTASVVCFIGTVGFIGLVGPHVARIFVGSDNRYLIPASAAFGAAFILMADSIAKITGPSGLPVGVICAMVGGPLFIWILISQRKRTWM